MAKRSTKKQKGSFIFIILLLILIGLLSSILIFVPSLRVRLHEGWKILTYESKRILGWEKN
ncbi:MAG: hypothetical protein ACXWM6_10770, partial [Thermodesulfobacteriota bacterium]